MAEDQSPELSIASAVPNPTAPHTKEHWGQFGIKQLVAITGIIAATIVAYAVGRHRAEQTQPLPTAPATAPSTELIDQKDREIDSLKRDKADLATKLQEARIELNAERAKENSLKRPPDRRRLTTGPSGIVTATSASGPALAAGPGAHDISQTINQFGHPPRHLTDEDRRALLAFSIPKEAAVVIGAPMGDSEAAGYGEEVCSFMKAVGYTNFKINNLTGSAVAPSIRALPSPPMFSFQKDPVEGTYNILIHQQR
jgi:hypothetical protein